MSSTIADPGNGSATDQRLEAARAYLADAAQRPVEHLPPSALMKELSAARRHIFTLLAVVSEAELAAFRPMDTSDLDPETGEEYGAR